MHRSNNQRFQELKEMLIEREYRPGLINAAIQKVRTIPILRPVRQANTSSMTPVFVVSFDPPLYNIYNITQKQGCCAGCRRRPSPNEAPPIGKIYRFSKMAITFVPLMGF